MTVPNVNSVKLTRNFTTVSGLPITIGTGSGTKWQWSKKGRSEQEQNTIHQDLVDLLLLAIKNGFNHLDTAEFYSTQPEIGAAIKQSGVDRNDLFVTTKYSPGFHTFEAVSDGPTACIENALKELQTDYIDLFLIHAPFFDEKLSRGQTLENAWKEMLEIKKSGKVRYIGVSNFSVDHLKTIFAISGVSDLYPVVNQIEFHPYLQEQTPGIVQFAKDNNILLEAYSPLTAISRVEVGGKSVDHPLKHLLPKLSEKYSKTPAQILLRYTLQKGLLPITTSAKEERIKQSLEIYQFHIDEDDVALIDSEGAKFKHRNFFADKYD
jgi:2-dehydropantolactone reductase